MCKFLIQLYILHLAIVLPQINCDIFRQKVPNIDVLNGRCPGGYPSNTPVQLKNVRLLKNHGVTYISGKIVVLQDTVQQYRIVLKSKKCDSRETLDTCQEVRDLNLDRICNGAMVFEKVLSPLIKSIQPKAQCPLKKGTYMIRNGTIDIGPLFAVPEADRWYWHGLALIYEQTSDVLVSCLAMQGQIVPV